MVEARRETVSDVCLITDNSYPFVYSETANWIKSLLTSHKNVSFSLVGLSDRIPSDRTALKYALPANVVSFSEIEPKIDRNGSFFLSKKEIRTIAAAYYPLLKAVMTDNADAGTYADLSRLFWTYKDRLGRNHLRGWEMWNVANAMYKELVPNSSFLGFYKTFIYFSEMIYSLLTYRLPAAAVYHCAANGCAGLLAVNAKFSTGRPVYISEYNIMAAERKIDILVSDLFAATDGMSLTHDKPSLKDIWANVLSSFVKVGYGAADRIISVSKDNSELQKSMGAEAAKCMVVPADVEYEKYSSLTMIPIEQRVLTVSLIADVDPENDIKTFLFAANKVLKYVPYVRFLIVGSFEKDKTYFKECKDIVSDYNLSDNVCFAGVRSVADVLRETDLLVSTALDDVMSYALLKGAAAGIPFVGADVGALPSLAFGRADDEDDKNLGQGAVIVDVMNPDDTAKGMVKLLLNYDLRRSMGKVLSARVKNGYNRDAVSGIYTELYRKGTLK